jgi:hypothetical protein
MAAMATSLTEFSDNGNSRVYTLSGHTVQLARQVLTNRQVPSGGQVIAEDKISVLYATTDVDGAVLPQRVLFTATVRRPITGDSADVTAALAVFRDIIAGDEFANVVNTQEHLS